ncbi:MAG: hypothetical protein GVY35_17020 [Bacteroidetes bacterium]|jgi:hypothetical protein|nr:hypothetical protein [Bacteroidota bacterium]
MDVFKSTHHPGDASATLIYGRALMAPLAFFTLPVMIAATAAALQQHRLLPFLTWGLPAALLAATVWTRFRLGATPAEVRVRDHQAAVRSVHDCLGPTPEEHWQWIHDIRRGSDALIVTMGFETHRFRYSTWPDHRALLKALRSARAGSNTPSQPASSHA